MKKWAKDMDKHFTEWETQMSNKHMKGHSTYGNQNKANEKFVEVLFLLIRLTKVKKICQ